MKKVALFLKTLWKDDAGVSAVEYGLIAGLMAALLVTVMGTFGDKLSDLFNAISDKLGDAAQTVNQQKTQ